MTKRRYVWMGLYLWSASMFDHGGHALGAPRADGEIHIDVVDSATGKPMPARMHLYSGRKAASNPKAKARANRPIKLNLPGSAEHGGHFYIDGAVTLPLRTGQYNFELEATPEYLTQAGQFDIQRHADDTKKIEMKRFVDLEKEGWFGGDLDVNRNAKDLPLILRAEGLQDVHITEFSHLLSDTSGKSAIPGTLRAPPSEIGIAPTPYAWNLPVWLANGDVQAIELIHRHALRDGVIDNEDDGRPRDKALFPGTRGNGRWSETVYYHVLNCGLRVPPVAGSGAGSNDNPVGTNRVYVFCGKKFSTAAWWEGLEAGRVFVTNGPLLRPLVEGEPPGYVFHATPGSPLALEIGLNLATRVPAEYLQIIKNGAMEVEVRLADWKEKKGKLPPVTFDASGWFLVRAVTSNPQTYQFASSGPYYVMQGDRPRISRKSVQFFLDWIDAAEARLRTLPKLGDADRTAQLAQQESARKVFADLLATANAE
jgi:hypothetical protein